MTTMVSAALFPTVSDSRSDFHISEGRVLRTTVVFDTYWQFAFERQEIFLKRVYGLPPPWTGDPILSSYRFTNVYRVCDRVSQYLIRRVIYDGDQSEEEVFFRTLLFKLFNRIETWEMLQEAVGPVCWKTFDVDQYDRILDEAFRRGIRLYSAAYIMPCPPFDAGRKHRNHLVLLDRMMGDRLPQKVTKARSLGEVFSLLRTYPSIGAFLAYQFAIDLNYSPLTSFSEMEFVVAGPGARSGIQKSFADTCGLTDEDVIRAVTELAAREFEQRGLAFRNLWGRPLQLIDCQNLFCEVDKYSRVAHPEIGASSRRRIKQRFVARARPTPQWYPPKWGLPSKWTTSRSQDGMGC
jgi:hypothetical protein